MAAPISVRWSRLPEFAAGPRTVSRSQRSRSSTIRGWPNPKSSGTSRKPTERWPLLGVTVIHRYGRIQPGENIVLVVTASSHRQAAFAAAEFLMDYLKTRAPFWKQVEKADGKSWVDAKAIDDTAAERWSVPRRGHEAAE